MQYSRTRTSSLLLLEELLPLPLECTPPGTRPLNIPTRKKGIHHRFSLNELMLGLSLFREGARVIWRHVDRILGQPSLVRESSRGKYPWSNIISRKKIVGAGGTPAVGGVAERTQAMKSGQGFGDVILRPSLHNRIRQLASVTANTKKHAAPYRNMLFYGPPGTGKTMAAKLLAQESVRSVTFIGRMPAV